MNSVRKNIFYNLKVKQRYIKILFFGFPQRNTIHSDLESAKNLLRIVRISIYFSSCGTENNFEIYLIIQ